MTKANQSLILSDELVMSKIYFIRGQKVRLDKDLAQLYGVTTGNLNLVSKEILKDFPKILCFSFPMKSSKI